MIEIDIKIDPILDYENFLRKTKKQHENLSGKGVTDNKTIMKIIKLYFCVKTSHFNPITLMENDSILTDDQNIAKTMNSFFINIIKDF